MKDLLDKLKEPFPKQAHGTDVSRGKNQPMTSIRAQWVVERLNDVFGFHGWEFRPRFENLEDVVICHGELMIMDEPGHVIRRVYNVGGCNKIIKSPKGEYPKMLADVYKSASTDSLTKCASWLCIGNDVFKGNVDPHTFEHRFFPTESVKKAADKVTEASKQVSPEKKAELANKYEITGLNDLYRMAVPKLEEIARAFEIAKISESVKDE